MSGKSRQMNLKVKYFDPKLQDYELEDLDKCYQIMFYPEMYTPKMDKSTNLRF